MNVIKALFLRELKTRFGETRLGYFWVFFEPMIHVTMLIFIFTFIKSRMIPNVPFELFLITGIVPFFLVRHIVFNVMDGAEANKSLFFYKPVTPMHVYLSRILLEIFIYSTIFFIMMFIAGWFFGFPAIPNDFLGAFFGFFILVLLGFSLGLCLATLIKKSKVFSTIIKNSFNFLYLGSGIMYPLWIIPEPYLSWILYNPFAQGIELIRRSYFKDYPVIDGVSLVYPLSISVILLFIGLWGYYHKRKELGASD